MNSSSSDTANLDLERQLERGFFPLAATMDGLLYPIGTALCMSRLGILLTAEHNVRAALLHHPEGDKLRSRDRLPDGLDLGRLGLSVIWKAFDERGGRVNIWPIESAHGAPPTDVLFAYPQFQTSFPFQVFRLSFDVPRIDSKVRCFGYSEMKPSDGLDLQELLAGRINWPEVYSHRFQCIEGRVKAIFIGGFSRGFIEGPCVVVECEVDHGMSGGPVINERGEVCGVVSAGASTFFGHEVTIVSLLYPLLLTEIQIGVQLGPLRLNAKNPLAYYISTGAVLTDGSEEGVSIQKVEGGVAIGPRIHRDDAHHVFDSFAAYQDRRSAEPYSGESWKIIVNANRKSGSDAMRLDNTALEQTAARRFGTGRECGHAAYRRRPLPGGCSSALVR